MPKKKVSVNMISYGLYEAWDRKHIPKLIRFTKTIPVALGHEFGYVLRFLNAKNQRISFTIFHPDFQNSRGQKAPPFTGEQYVKSNDYLFFLGDTFWEPLQDKTGVWELVTKLEGNNVANMCFDMQALS
jgi:hypothetical protein